MSLSRLNKTFALSQSFWVIQEISTGNYIPEPKSIGKHLYYTQVNPTNKGVPRLFNNRPSAAKALGKYIEGIFKKIGKMVLNVILCLVDLVIVFKS